MKSINAFKCDFCSKLYQLERFAISHEKSCTKNPENDRACFNCSNLSKESFEIDNGDEYHRPFQVKLLYCKAKKICVHPPSVEYKGNAIETGEPNDPMPKECDQFKNWIGDEDLNF